MAVRKTLKKLEGHIRPLDKWELLERINKIKGRKQTRDKALASFLYLGGFRIEEVLTHYDDKTKTIKGQPILKRQVELFDTSIIISTVRTLKRRKPIYRTIPIVRNELEKEFINLFLDHCNTLSEEEYLFKIKRSRAQQIFAKVYLFPHYFRHIRNTILATKYNFTASELRHWNAWHSSISGDAYVHLAYQDLLNKMKRIN